MADKKKPAWLDKDAKGKDAKDKKDKAGAKKANPFDKAKDKKKK